MPLHDESSLPPPGHPYFESLDDLDKWTDTPRLQEPDRPAIPFQSRSEPDTSRKGKLLVCHDYKGGYTESPFSPCYTFNFWHLCKSFVYFSHHRVTIPPIGWINTAHRQGVKMLGTLIFEGGADQDCLRLLIGRLPKAKTGPASHTSQVSLPVSPYYARVLANLARTHGFDGYLLNFECPLRGGIEQTRALSAWIQLFQAELKSAVGPHAELSWYDSVIINGRLAWQDRLNSLNLPFFVSADTFFTNYTWRPDYPTATAQYFLSLDSSPSSHAKSLQDIYMGIDVWGRGSHGGGGFGAYRALDHINPDSLGLSVALFGPAWTWESEQDRPGWSWESWWNYERSLWVGGAKVVVPEMPGEEGQPECPHGSYKPISHYFVPQTPPDPALLSFHTTFSPGVGWRWFVDGKEVMHLEKGWTDIDKQTSIGDLVWPKPTISWYGDPIEDSNGTIPEATSSLCMSDAWNGGTSLELVLTDTGSDAAVLQTLWIPIQTLGLTPGTTYHATAVYKIADNLDVDRDVVLFVEGESAVTPLPDNDSSLASGWTKLSAEIQATKDCASGVSLGLIVTIIREDPSIPLNLPILLGQMNVFQVPSREYTPAVIWADYDLSSSQLSWGTATSLPVATALTITSPDDPKPVWTIPEPPQSWFPSFLYFNIYAQDLSAAVSGPEQAKFVGTSISSITFTHRGLTKPTRFYVQGVTDRGETLPWTQCAYVDIEV